MFFRIKKLIYLSLLALYPLSSFAGLTGYVSLNEFLNNEPVIKEGSYVGVGSNHTFQLTLLQFSEAKPLTHVVIIEKLKNNGGEVLSSLVLYGNPKNPKQLNLMSYFMDESQTRLVVSIKERMVNLVLRLDDSNPKNLQMILDVESPHGTIFQDEGVILFESAKTPQILRTLDALGENPTFSVGKNRFSLAPLVEGEALVGYLVDLLLVEEQSKGGQFLLQSSSVPGLFYLKKQTTGAWVDSIENTVSYVVYFSRKATSGALGWGENSTDYVTAVSTLSPDGYWELWRAGE